MTSKTKHNISWSAIEKCLDQNTPSTLLIAIIEADKILRRQLEKLHLPGKEVNNQLNFIQSIFEDYEKLAESRAVYQRILDEPEIELDLEEVEDILNTYYQAIIDLTENPNTGLNAFQRGNLWLAEHAPSGRKVAIIIVIIVVAFFAIIAFLDRTETGELVGEKLVAFTNIVLSWVTLIVIAAIGGIMAIIATTRYSRKHSEDNIKIED